MKIRYNETAQTIEINDGLKTQYWLMNFVAITTIFNSILFPVFVLDEKQLAWFGFIWVILGILSLIGLTSQILRKSASEKLKISEISGLVEKDFLGRKKFSLKLKNGKSRDLLEMRKQKDIIETKRLLQNIGITPFENAI